MDLGQGELGVLCLCDPTYVGSCYCNFLVHAMSKLFGMLFNPGFPHSEPFDVIMLYGCSLQQRYIAIGGSGVVH